VLVVRLGLNRWRQWGRAAVPASSACYGVYMELSAYNAERARWDVLHQEAVDAYAAQHPGPPTKP
jgi:hypothetical protein